MEDVLKDKFHLKKSVLIVQIKQIGLIFFNKKKECEKCIENKVLLPNATCANNNDEGFYVEMIEFVPNV